MRGIDTKITPSVANQGQRSEITTAFVSFFSLPVGSIMPDDSFKHQIVNIEGESLMMRLLS